VNEREPDFEPIELFVDEAGGQLSIDDQYRTLSLALGRPW
jgi:hypothetical protein